MLLEEFSKSSNGRGPRPWSSCFLPGDISSTNRRILSCEVQQLIPSSGAVCEGTDQSLGEQRLPTAHPPFCRLSAYASQSTNSCDKELEEDPAALGIRPLGGRPLGTGARDL